MAATDDDVWTLDRFHFPDHWWDRHLIRTERGDVLPLGSRYPDGTAARGPVVTGEFDIPESLEDRKATVRRIVAENLKPRSVVDPTYTPTAHAVRLLAGERPQEVDNPG